MTPSVDEITSSLAQVRYPATREELIAAAAASDASPDVIARLESLGDESFENLEAVSRELVFRRAESNPALVAITLPPCEQCGFPRVPGEPHSCVEEKARFADGVNAVTDEFDRIDESIERQAVSEDLRSGEDRRAVDMDVPDGDRRSAAGTDEGGERRGTRPRR